MDDSYRIFASSSTQAGNSSVFNNYSLCGLIKENNQEIIAQQIKKNKVIQQDKDNTLNYVYFQSLLPMSNQDLFRYMICLSQQLIDIEIRKIQIEEINIQTLKTEPIQNQSYIFFIQEQSNHKQDLTRQYKNLLNQLRFDKNIYQNATNLQQLGINLIRESNPNEKQFTDTQIEQNFRNFNNSLKYVKEEIKINFSIPKNNLYNNNLSQCQIYQITRPNFINCQQQDIVVKIVSQNEEKYLKEIKILESFYDDFNFNYYGYFRFQDLTFTFLKEYKQTLTVFQEKFKSHLKGNLNDKQLIQSIFKRTFIQIIQQVDLLSQKYHIIHRDLKPQNIMIDSENDLKELQDYLDAKYIIIDFDCSIQLENYKREVFYTYGGSDNYIPPEASESNYSEKYDVYQIGVIILETIFEINTNIKLWTQIDELNKQKCSIDIDENLKTQLIQMVSECPERRPSLKDIQQLLEKQF